MAAGDPRQCRARITRWTTVVARHSGGPTPPGIGQRPPADGVVREAERPRLLPEIGPLPGEVVETLVYYSVELGPERMRELIAGSRSATLLRPLLVALKQELWSTSRAMRTVIELPEEQLRRLADVCRREGVSRAEVIRRAVADYLDARHVRDSDDVFGLWRDRNLDGLQYERRRRREWP